MGAHECRVRISNFAQDDNFVTKTMSNLHQIFSELLLHVTWKVPKNNYVPCLFVFVFL